MDLSTFINIAIGVVGLILTVISIVITTVVIIRSRQLARPSLKFFAGWNDPKVFLPRKQRKLPRQTLIFGTKPIVEDKSVLFCPYVLGNETNLPVTNITLEFKYPKEFLLDESVFIDNENNKAVYIKTSSDANSQRNVTKFGDTAIVRYEIPMLRPGEHLMLTDFIAMPKLKEGISPSAEPRMLSKSELYKRFADVDNFFGICVVQATIWSANCPPIAQEIVLISYTAKTLGEIEKSFNATVKKSWDNRLIGGYYLNPLGMSLIKKLYGIPELFNDQIAEIIVQTEEIYPTDADTMSQAMSEFKRVLVQVRMPPWGIYGRSRKIEDYVGDIYAERSWKNLLGAGKRKSE